MPVRFSSLIMTDTQTSLYMVVNTVNGSQSLVRVVTHVTTHVQVYPQSYISAGHPIIIYLDACKHHKSQNWQAMEKKLVQVKSRQSDQRSVCIRPMAQLIKKNLYFPSI